MTEEKGSYIMKIHHVNRLIWGMVVLVFLLAGCATSSMPGSTADIADAQEVYAEEDGTGTYQIGPGDTLKIFVWRNEDISITVPVRPDGRISTPLVKEMPVVGKTPSQLARDIEEALKQYIKNPVVTVIVTDFVGTFGEQIRVVGQATKPQALPYRENITLLDVMIEVGGLTEFAAGNRAKIVRKVDGGSEEIKVRIEDLIENGDISANPEMKPGDVLIIPESWL